MDYERFTPDTIPHYHGDKVRFLFLLTVALGFIGIPFWGHLVPFGTMFEVVGGIVLVVLAGLASPHSKWVMVLSVIAAAFGAFLLEISAISFHDTDSIRLLLAREAGALMLAAALYYSVKTLRAMTTGKLGAQPTPEEFAPHVHSSDEHA